MRRSFANQRANYNTYGRHEMALGPSGTKRQLFPGPDVFIQTKCISEMRIAGFHMQTTIVNFILEHH